MIDGLVTSSKLGDVVLGLLPGLRELRLREDVKVGQNSIFALGLAGVAPHVGLSALVERAAESIDFVVVGSIGTVTTD